MLDVDVDKSDVNWVHLGIETRIGKKGLILLIKTDPKIESFIKDHSEGTVPLVECSNLWKPIDPPNVEVYQQAPKGYGNGGLSYTFSGVSEYVIDPTGRVNLSILTLVGTSQRSGVRISVDTPTSPSMIREMGKKILEGTKEYIRDNFVPIHLELRVSSKEF